MDELAVLENGYDRLGALVASLRPGDLDAPSGCSEWDGRDVLDHLLGGTWMFAAAADGNAGADDDAGEVSGDDPAAALEAAVKTALAAWRAPGVMDRMVTLPIGTMPGRIALGVNATEVVVHGWDLSIAAGSPLRCDDGEAEVLLDVAAQLDLDMLRAGGALGPPVDVESTAPPFDRLLALLGRRA